MEEKSVADGKSHGERALKMADGNKSKAAEILNIHRRLLDEKMREHGVAEPSSWAGPGFGPRKFTRVYKTFTRREQAAWSACPNVGIAGSAGTAPP